MQTSMRVDQSTRDALARVAAQEMGGASLDHALRALLFEHQTRVALERLQRDPEAARGYRNEAIELAEADIEVTA